LWCRSIVQLISALLKRQLARRARLTAVLGDAGIWFGLDSAHQGVLWVKYYDDMEDVSPYSSGRHFTLRIGCQLANDSDTQVVYIKPQLDLWGVEGVRMSHKGPSILISAPTVGWRQANSIVVPAHGIVAVRFEMKPIASTFGDLLEAIEETYAGTVASLRVTDTAGRTREFRVVTSSFAGRESVTWPSRLKYPVYTIRALNAAPRRAGKQPQERRSTEVGAVAHVSPLSRRGDRAQY